MREFAIFNISYEEGLEFTNEMKHQDMNSLQLNFEEYSAIVSLYGELLSKCFGFEYEQWIDDSSLAVNLTVEGAMKVLNALHRILMNGNLHIRIIRAVEKIVRKLSMANIEAHR